MHDALRVRLVMTCFLSVTSVENRGMVYAMPAVNARSNKTATVLNNLILRR